MMYADPNEVIVYRVMMYADPNEVIVYRVMKYADPNEVIVYRVMIYANPLLMHSMYSNSKGQSLYYSTDF